MDCKMQSLSSSKGEDGKFHGLAQRINSNNSNITLLLLFNFIFKKKWDLYFKGQ